MQNLQQELIQLLEQVDNYIIDGQLNKTIIVEAALKLDPSLLRILIKSETFKKHFFKDIDGVLVFDKIEFQRFVNNKSFLPDSYTAFKNKIGLTINDESLDNFITSRNDVVLAWPHKDCVLEGGQTKEDQKRNEIFWNETLAPDNVDRLLSPKAFTNFKRYEAVKSTKKEKSEGLGLETESEGLEVKETKLSGKEEIDFSKENLIIKGNNLLALASLLKTHRGKVKLIYIDPPYNTGSVASTFAYNNSFNHSAWLTFMKNRIQIAKQLLSPDGIFVIAIDHFELFYLGVLCDELFNKDNRLGVIAAVHNPGGRQDDKYFPTAHENMIFYSKNKELVNLNTLGMSDSKLSQYKYEDEYGKYKLRGFQRSGSNSTRTARPKLYYPIYLSSDGTSCSLEKDKTHSLEILPIDDDGVERCWRWGKKTFEEKYKKYIEIKLFKKDSYKLYTKERESDYLGEKAKTIWNNSNYSGQTGTNVLKNLGFENLFSYPKSPFMIKDVIEICTNKGDLVLDFFAGSGTTAAVAHKMGRKFITTEQMDYIEDVTKERLKKVLQGEQGGISKEVNWKGGGSFTYLELMPFNQTYIDKIQAAKTKDELISIWKEMKEGASLSYLFDSDVFDERLDAFKTASLEDMKKYLVEVLDKNQLYVNYSEIEDKDYQVSQEDIALNHQFYKKK